MKKYFVVKHETICTVPSLKEAEKLCQEFINDDPENDYVVVEGMK